MLIQIQVSTGLYSETNFSSICIYVSAYQVNNYGSEDNIPHHRHVLTHIQVSTPLYLETHKFLSEVVYMYQQIRFLNVAVKFLFPSTGMC